MKKRYVLLIVMAAMMASVTVHAEVRENTNEYETVPAETGNTTAETKIVEKHEPTCEEPGYVITDTGGVIEHKEIPATGHDFTEWRLLPEKLVGTKDEETGIFLWNETWRKKRTCHTCGYTERANETQADYRKIIERHPPTCKSEGYVIVDENGKKNKIVYAGKREHSYKIIAFTEPTEKQKGSATMQCSECGEKETVVIEGKLGQKQNQKIKAKKTKKTAKSAKNKKTKKKKKKKNKLSVSVKGKRSIKLKRGKRVKIKVKKSKKSGKVKFKSSNKKVATVSKKGVIRAKKKGKAVITVTWKGIKKKIKVRVK